MNADALWNGKTGHRLLRKLDNHAATASRGQESSKKFIKIPCKSGELLLEGEKTRTDLIENENHFLPGIEDELLQVRAPMRKWVSRVQDVEHDVSLSQD